MNYLLIRGGKYYRKYGFLSSIYRLWIIVIRTLFQNSSIIYFSNLTDLKASPQNYFDLELESKKKEEDLTEENCKQLYAYQDKRILESQMKNRFNKGAVLWLAKLNDEIVGFIWTIRRRTIKPFFFPLLESDAYLFDNEILSDYRGKGINPVFIDKVLIELKHEGYIRAFIDTRLWNKPEIHSLKKTCFMKLALVRQVRLLEKNIVIWGDPKHLQNN